MRAYTDDYDNAAAVAWSRTVTSPLLAMLRDSEDGEELDTPVAVDERRAVATCLKPADRGGAGSILRVWETAGQSGPVAIAVPGFSRAIRTDLLERDQEELCVVGGSVSVPLAAHGFGAIRLLR